MKKVGKNKGSLLLELLITISLIAIIFSFGANAIFLSMRGNQVAGQRDTASTLASETLEAVRSITEENWQNIYGLTKATQHYYPTVSLGKWITASGDETVSLNNISYTRYITVDNVSRDAVTRNIENTYTSANDDPSTQKITVTVSWPNGDPLVISEYFYRWKNEVCPQGSWLTGGSGSNVQTCTSSTYDTKDDGIDVSDGSIKLQ